MARCVRGCVNAGHPVVALSQVCLSDGRDEGGVGTARWLLPVTAGSVLPDQPPAYLPSNLSSRGGGGGDPSRQRAGNLSELI